MNFENYLKESLTLYEDSRLKEAMEYALLAGGKRIRPQLIFHTLKAFNRKEELGYAYACALEYIHTYSLIHDDLPAMDNDVLRRGKASVHVVYGEDIAILAGDALLTEAFFQLTRNSLSDKQNLKALEILSTHAGANGMVLGQVMDMRPEQLNNRVNIETMLEKKTGRLLEVALELGAIAANQFENLKIFQEAGKWIGLAFQIQDDLFDIEKTAEELGKSNSDEENDKQTLLKLIGPASAKELEKTYYYRGIECLKSIPNLNSSILMEYIQSIQKRQY
ncbi:polyprenyl synthetase family protein [Bulleidia sp. zg-1006]|uniref:polyprenyl synthetase family protein n=1 Tax=Bulleidia sp. zg-1006 TaxID=2806552 RepID=UPI00193AD4CE|nr:farnesyl diphosphate synthase [Bulleidia sp. zg-1006]QRG87390.1 polyprenyl synthetase family protein [Bulleidia sp. zg-1006]